MPEHKKQGNSGFAARAVHMGNETEYPDQIQAFSQVNPGGTISPFNFWLIKRGSMPLPPRMRQLLYPGEFSNGFFHFSVDIEDVEDTIGALKQALEKVGLEVSE